MRSFIRNVILNLTQMEVKVSSNTRVPMFFSLFNNKFIRFLMVGGINTLFGYSVYALLLFLNFHYSLAAIVSTFFGILFNFKTTGRLVFLNNDNILFFKFVGVYALTCLINIIALKIFDTFDVDLYLAGAIMLLPMAGTAFLLNKKFVFEG